jgi:hypothetical protein
MGESWLSCIMSAKDSWLHDKVHNAARRTVMRMPAHPQNCPQSVVLLHMPPEALEAPMLGDELITGTKQGYCLCVHFDFSVSTVVVFCVREATGRCCLASLK